VLHAGGTAVLARGWLSVPERARRAHRDYIVGAYDLEPLAGATSFRWTSGDARFLWAAKTRWLLLRLWVQHPDAATSPVRSPSTAAAACGGPGAEIGGPLNVGLELPEGWTCSRRPCALSHLAAVGHAPGDTRQLGVAVVSDWLKSAASPEQPIVREIV
jgi:hypothetical protein